MRADLGGQLQAVTRRPWRRPSGPPAEPPRPAGAADPDAPAVAADLCRTCVFHPGNPLQLRPGRLAEVLDHNRDAGTMLVCHVTTYGQRPDLGEVLCRGYWNTHGAGAGVVQVWHRLGGHFRAVDVDEPPGAPTGAPGRRRGLLRP